MSVRPGAVGVVLAAGMGTRVGADGNKAYLDWPAAAWCRGRSTPCAHPRASTAPSWCSAAVSAISPPACSTSNYPRAAVEFVEGGETRHGSEWNVLRHLSDDIESGAVDVVLIHDAARPLAGSALMSTALATAREFGGAIPGVAGADVMRTDADGRLSAARHAGAGPDSAGVSRAAAAAAYRAADAGASRAPTPRRASSDSPTSHVHVFPGAATNLKVTFAARRRWSPTVCCARRSVGERHAMIASSSAASAGRATGTASASTVDGVDGEARRRAVECDRHGIGAPSRRAAPPASPRRSRAGTARSRSVVRSTVPSTAPAASTSLTLSVTGHRRATTRCPAAQCGDDAVGHVGGDQRMAPVVHQDRRDVVQRRGVPGPRAGI